MKVTVETEDLRQALRSVAPHADPDADFAQLHRIRLEVGGENLTVSATNRYTIAHALVSLWDTDGEIVAVDLSPRDVKDILAMFCGRKKSADDPDEVLMIEATSKYLTVTDAGGLFLGKQLQLPRYPMEDQYPNIGSLLAEKIHRGALGTERLITSGEMLGLFMKAAAAYGEPLVLDPAGDKGSILVTCGESFVGVLTPIRSDEETTRKIADWHYAWTRRIEAMAVPS